MEAADDDTQPQERGCPVGQLTTEVMDVMRLFVLLVALAGFQQPACAHWRQIEGFGAQPVVVPRTRRSLRTEGELWSADRELHTTQHTHALSVAVRRLLEAEEVAEPPDEGPETTTAVAGPEGEQDTPVDDAPPAEDPADPAPPDSPGNTTAPPAPTPIAPDEDGVHPDIPGLSLIHI